MSRVWMIGSFSQKRGEGAGGLDGRDEVLDLMAWLMA